MKKTVVFSDEAVGEITEAVIWYEARGAKLGVSFIQALDKAVEKISHYPESYPIVHRQARMGLLHRFPYLVIYCVFQDFISVIAVMHGKRHSSRWQSRLKNL